MKSNSSELLGEAINQMKKENSHGILKYPKGKEAKFEIFGILDKVLDDDKESFLNKVEENYKYGRENFADNHQSGIDAIKIYIYHTVSRRFHEEVSISIKFDQEEISDFLQNYKHQGESVLATEIVQYSGWMSFDKNSRDNERKRIEKTLEENEHRKYWEGYDARVREEQEEKREYAERNRGFFSSLLKLLAGTS